MELPFLYSFFAELAGDEPGVLRKYYPILHALQNFSTGCIDFSSIILWRAGKGFYAHWLYAKLGKSGSVSNITWKDEFSCFFLKR